MENKITKQFYILVASIEHYSRNLKNQTAKQMDHSRKHHNPNPKKAYKSNNPQQQQQLRLFALFGLLRLSNKLYCSSFIKLHYSL